MKTPSVRNGSKITVRRIHRAEPAPLSWWHQTTVCDLPGAYRPEQLGPLARLLPRLKAMGFEAVLLRLEDADVDKHVDVLTVFVAEAHAVKMRVLVRVTTEKQLPHPDMGASLAQPERNLPILEKRVEALARTGVDGIDLGMLEDAPLIANRAERSIQFTDSLQRQLAQVVDLDDTVILSAKADRESPDFFDHHLREEWFHHLGDNVLTTSPWEANSLKQRVQETYSNWDALGRIVAWHPSPGGRDDADSSPGWREGTWGHQAPDERFDAMITFAAALPGVLYLPFEDAGGQLADSDLDLPTWSLGRGARDFFRHDLIHRLMHLRQANGLGNASLSVLEGVHWAEPTTVLYFSGTILVVLNTGTAPVRVPADHTPVLSSAGLAAATDEGTLVDPDTCVWFKPGLVPPSEPLEFR